MSAREQFLAESAVSPDNVESLIKKHEDFDKAINSQQEKITALENFASQLIDQGHYDSANIAKKRNAILGRSVNYISETMRSAD